MTENKDALNSQAYNDVLDTLEPKLPNNVEYMRFYREWRAIVVEKYFDRYYIETDCDCCGYL